jgi:ubiquinone/menaquinone biosynthesis C-methylase UbiE
MDTNTLNDINNKAYREIYQEFDKEAYVDKQVAELIDILVANTPEDGLILDLGCGNGYYTEYISKKRKVIGIDLSPDFIDFNKKKYSDLAFQVGDMRRLEFEDHSISGIIAIASMIHIPKKEHSAVLKEFRRVLRDNGMLVFIMNLPYGNDSASDGLETRERLGKEVTRYFARYLPEDFKNILIENGYKVVKDKVVSLKTPENKRLSVLAEVKIG